MSLRQMAKADLAGIVEDKTTGFGWDVILTSPDKTQAAMIALTNDISQVIDPETGEIVSGRLVTVAFRLSSLDSGLGRPVGISDATAKPWVVEFDDISGASGKFKVKESNPDRALGLLVCILEAYE